MDTDSVTNGNWFTATEISDNYSKYRPMYDTAMYEKILVFCKQQKGFQCNLAVDVGCGSGQSTFPLAERFDSIVGVDVSESQIKFAREKNNTDNIQFRCGQAEDLNFIESGSMDLLLVGTAIHWFDKEKFFAEARRVLNPKTGHIAVYSYTYEGRDNADSMDLLTKQFFRDFLKSEEYYTKKFGSVGDTLDDLELPFAQGTRIQNVILRNKMALSSYVQFLTTASNFQCAIGPIWTRKEAMERLKEFQKYLEDLSSDWTERTEDTNEAVITLDFPVDLHVARISPVDSIL